MTKQVQLYLAKAFSAVLHPLMMPFYLALACLFVHPIAPYISLGLKFIYLGIATVSFITLPVLILTILKAFKLISSINLEKQKERALPFFLIALCYQLGIALLSKLSAPYMLILIMNGATLSIIMIAIVSIFWKISAHLTGMGGAFAAVFLINITFYTNFTTMAVAITLLAGGLGWARLYLNRHTIKQVSYGFMAGLCIIPLPYFFRLL